MGNHDSQNLNNDFLRPNMRVGKYTLIKRIGFGTFGEVWHGEVCEDPGRGLDRAIKFPNVSKGTSRAVTEAAPMMLREGKIQKKLTSDDNNEDESKIGKKYIVKIHEWEILENIDEKLSVGDIQTAIKNGQMLIAMEYIAGGKTLKDLIKGVKITYGQVAKIMLGVCRAVDFAHDMSKSGLDHPIYHRDLKPENILIDQQDNPKVTDFGIAAAAHQQRFFPHAGTVLYMSPERLQPGPYTYAAGDIWAIGVILYEMLSGKHPFPAQSIQDVEARIKDPNDPPMPLRQHDPKMPDELVTICDECLHKQQHSRCPSVDWIVKELEKWEKSHEIGTTVLQPNRNAPRVIERIERVLDEYSRQCVRDWDPALLGEKTEANRQPAKPDRFVEPHLAIRRDAEQLVDRSMLATQDPDKLKEAYQSLLSDDEKADNALDPHVQYVRLLKHDGKEHWRVCVTEDAGSGKTILTQRLRAFLASDPARKEFFGGKPPLVVRFESRATPWPADVRAALEQEVEKLAPAEGLSASQVVDHALQQKRVVVLLDALDQVTGDHHQLTRQQLLDRLFAYLNSDEGQNCRWIVTGRSYAVTRETEGDRFPREHWSFATLEGFDKRQQRRFLHGLFPPDNDIEYLLPTYDQVKELFEVPVILSLIARIAAREMQRQGRNYVQLEQYRTRADVYHAAHEELVDRAKKLQGLSADVDTRRKWEAILAAAAFAMMCDQDYRKTYAVTGTDHVGDVKDEARQWCRDAGGYKQPIAPDDWKELKTFSELTNHASLEDCEDVMLSWKHRGWMEYFCGLYLARYAPEETVEIIRPFANEPDWRWAWRFAIEQRGRLRRTQHQQTLCRSLAQLFQPPQTALRPTELIYRAWHLFEFDELLMREILGDEAQNKSAEELEQVHQQQMKLPGAEQVMAAFRQSSRELVEQMQANTKAQQDKARKLGHKKWLRGWQKETSRTKSRTLVPCPPQTWVDEHIAGKRPHDPCVNVMGEGQSQDDVTVAPFHVLATPVTRGLYRLFDRNFEDSREAASWGGIIAEQIQEKASPPENADGEEADADQYPIIITDWYDAWVFCKWLGPQFLLPTERQHEFAIRGGSDKKYCYGDSEDQLKKYAWYDENSEGHAHAVGLLRPNDYGMFDGHGQVWEWSWDWYSVGSSRVLRGGSWYDIADYCRSAYRFHDEPVCRDFRSGFRVVWCVSVESSQSSS